MASFHDVLRLMDHGGTLAEGRQDAFQLPALRTSVAEARRRVLERLSAWGVDDESRCSMELVVSELVTNVVRHTDSEKLGCELRSDGRRLRLEVTDEGCAATEPHPGSGDVDGESGRGLLLVDALSRTWGVHPGTSGRGHVVWAELECTAELECNGDAAGRA
ncbi:ATP-binding protein [Streptomyces sp. NPDC002055]|uniref:ATP-binding protein n=1 Tax=Streptomyces sp. NPDC002055 TaxID=3154534 RepID=UPI00332B647F